MKKKINKNILINYNEKISDAIYKIDKNGLRTLIVLKKKKVIGVITQGDIIRIFLKGISLTNSIEEIIQHNFKYLYEDDLNKASKIIKKELLLLLPVVNRTMKLISVITIKDIFFHE